MAFDISDLHSKSMGAVNRAKGGDLRPLVELLRSKEELDPRLRDYLADEIEKPPGSRFRRGAGRSDVERRKKDLRILSQVHKAKFHIAGNRLGLSSDNSDEEWVDAGIYDHLETVSDADAIRFLSTEWGIEIDGGHLNNVRNRNPNQMFNSRRKRRQKL